MKTELKICQTPAANLRNTRGKNPPNVYLLFLILLVDGGQAAHIVIQAHAETQKFRSLFIFHRTKYRHAVKLQPRP